MSLASFGKTVACRIMLSSPYPMAAKVTFDASLHVRACFECRRMTMACDEFGPGDWDVLCDGKR
jgi:hypothetical protein